MKDYKDYHALLQAAREINYAADTIKSLRDSLIPHQRAVLDSLSKYRAVLCSRRAGKSYMVGVLCSITAISNPGTTIIINGLTRQSLSRIYVKDIFNVLKKQHDLRFTLNKSELSITFDNGSIIYFLGTDSSEKEQEKARGQKFSLVVIDEAQAYSTDIQSLIDDVYAPATMDLGGAIILTGTPGDIPVGYFHDITNTNKHDLQYAKFFWHTSDNMHCAPQYEEELAEKRRVNPDFLDGDTYKREWLGQWVTASNNLVYQYCSVKNGTKVTGNNFQHYILGVDLGFNDATSFTVGAYNRTEKKLYFLESTKESQLTITAVAKQIEQLQQIYTFDHIIIDGSAKQVVEELRQRFGLNLTAADKTNKAHFISVMNCDFTDGNIQVDVDGCVALIDEWQKLAWDKKRKLRGQLVEKSSCDNHCADSALYIWRFSLHFLSVPTPPRLTEEQKMEEYFEELTQKLIKKKDLDFWEREF